MSLHFRILLLTLGLCLLAVVGAVWAIAHGPHSPGEAVAVVLAFLVLAGAGVAWFLAGVRGALAQLREAAERLQRGEPAALQHTGVPEFDEVAAALNEADARVRESARMLEERVQEATREALAAQARLDQSAKLEALGRLTSGIAHDFNNLLHTLNLGLQVIEQRTQDPQSRRMVEACQRAAFRARALIQQLQSFSKRQPLQLAPVDLADRLLAVEPLLTKALPPDIALHLNVSPDLWAARTDPSQLELALLNLLFNARDAMPNGGRIVVSAYNARNTRLGDMVCIEVADVGSGIDPEVLPKVFDPFFTTKGKGQGTGLGLSQVYHLASGSGGDVEIESAPHVGTVVRLMLPKSQEPPARAARRRALSLLAGPVRVLFVEDDPLVSKVTAAALTGLGFEVIQASTADEALKQLEAGISVQAVFSDIVMPGRMSGVDLAEAVALRWPGLPVVLATGYGERVPSHLRVRLMTKPYLIEEAAQALLEAIAEPPAAQRMP